MNTEKSRICNFLHKSQNMQLNCSFLKTGHYAKNADEKQQLQQISIYEFATNNHSICADETL